jgi:periplasmic divalent cation tolerance protein
VLEKRTVKRKQKNGELCAGVDHGGSGRGCGENRQGSGRTEAGGCVQISPITSIYRWQGNVETAREWRLCAKTREDLCEAADRVIASLSSYSVPEVIVTPIIAGSESYLAWLDGELAGK